MSTTPENTIYYKLISRDEFYLYKLGLNKSITYISNNIKKIDDYQTLKATISSNDLKRIEMHKLKTTILLTIINPTFLDHISLSTSAFTIISISDLEKDQDLCKYYFSQNPCLIRLIENQTPEQCKIAVNYIPYLIKYVKEQTPELCKIAVTQNGLALQYVKEKTYDIIEIAIRQNIDAIQFIKNLFE